MKKSNESGYTAVELLMAGWGLVCLALGAALVYAVVHVVAKFW